MRSIHSLLLVITSLLMILLCNCTVWQYEIESCNPDMGISACAKLNNNPELFALPKCKLYQCNAETRKCELAPRDFDQDGEVDSACDGTDCLDSDPTINMANGKCNCLSAGSPCTVGVGACRVSTVTECQNGKIVCPATNVPQSRSVAWQEMPYTANTITSWDWNCNSSGDSEDNSEYLCNTNLQSTENKCEKSQCEIWTASGTLDGKCDQLCRSKNETECGDFHFVSCKEKCGSPVYVCKCYFDILWRRCFRDPWVNSQQSVRRCR